MRTVITKALVTLAMIGASASIASAAIVTSLGSTINSFNSPAQFQANTLPVFTYAIAVGNTVDQTVGGYTFQHDAPGTETTAFIDPAGLGYSMSNAKTYGGNTPTMSDPNLNLLLEDNRYGNNNSPDSFTLPVTVGTTYSLQLMMWENFYTGGSGRPVNLEIIPVVA